VAGREHQHVLGAHPVGELELELEMERRRAVEEAGAGEARAVVLERVARGGLHPLVAREAEIVVGAEHDRGLPLDLHLRPGLRLDQAEVGEEVALAGRLELLEALVRARFLEDVDGRADGLGHFGKCRLRRCP
jgi:hypothetical protein